MNTELTKIISLAKKIDREVRLMELCGSHSQAIARYGTKDILPENIKLISGPGCPVCVTDQEDIDTIVGLALKNIPIATYGDMLHVPGNIMSLEQARQQGADIQDVYDVTAALKLKESKPDLIFFGIGFETTTPMTAWAIKQGLTVYSSHKLFPPAMSALLANPDLRVDGFINPGHVSAIIGTDIYNQFKIPQAITGFEADDILISIKNLLEQIINNSLPPFLKLKGRAGVGSKIHHQESGYVFNQYSRVVRKEGNSKAREAINDVFEISSARWRGLGTIPASGLEIRKKYQTQDAKFIYQDLIRDIKKDIKPKYSACQCGQVLQGMIEPKDCKLFNKVCNPDNPQGACMVSTEGSCHIAYRYSRNS